MAQQYDGHLTSEQLSAFLDKQLSSQEQLDWNAHLRACQQCQRRLADLRQTVALLHALPQPDLPRSFVLPTSTTLAPEHHLHPVGQGARVRESGGLITPIVRARRKMPSIMQRSVRALSTIAAVVGFLLIVSGFLAGAHIGAGGGASTASTVSSGAGTTANHGTVAPPKVSQPSQSANATTTGTERPVAATPQVTRTPRGTVKAGPTPGHQLSLPPVLDLGAPEGLEGVGAILVVLGILGLIVMRIARRRDVRT